MYLIAYLARLPGKEGSRYRVKLAPCAATSDMFQDELWPYEQPDLVSICDQPANRGLLGASDYVDHTCLLPEALISARIPVQFNPMDVSHS